LFPPPKSDCKQINENCKKNRFNVDVDNKHIDLFTHQFAIVKSSLVASRVVKVEESKDFRGLIGLLEKFKKFVFQSIDLHLMSKFVEFGTKSYCYEVLHLTIYESRKKTKEDVKMIHLLLVQMSEDPHKTRDYEIKLFLTS
jgi:hypothetical protein